MSFYRDSIFVKSCRCLMSSGLFSISFMSAWERFVCEPFSVLIKWFSVLGKFDWKVDWLMSRAFDVATLSDELYKWLLSWGSGVRVGYWMFWWWWWWWWCKPLMWLEPGDDVVITLEIELSGIPETIGFKLRKLGTKKYY